MALSAPQTQVTLASFQRVHYLTTTSSLYETKQKRVYGSQEECFDKDMSKLQTLQSIW